MKPEMNPLDAAYIEQLESRVASLEAEKREWEWALTELLELQMRAKRLADRLAPAPGGEEA